jgi:hypothetical protein
LKRFRFPLRTWIALRPSTPEKVGFNVDLGVNTDGDSKGTFVLLIDLYTSLAPV